jgi:hypothetical protein
MFPILFSERMGYDEINLQQERRNAFEKGYHQAEEDLELTWEDIRLIDTIASKLLVSHGNLDDEEFYKEVLKRFKDFKERKGK